MTTYRLDALLGTKLRALYQRRKGRDRFDPWYSMRTSTVDLDAMVLCFSRYMDERGHSVALALYEANLHDKSQRKVFRGDMDALLRPGVDWTSSTDSKTWSRGCHAVGESPPQPPEYS